MVKNGDIINYSINVKNTSNDDMKNVLVKDMIPEYTEYASSEEQDGVITGTRTLNDKLYATFVIESLPAGEEKTVSFAVTVTEIQMKQYTILIPDGSKTRMLYISTVESFPLKNHLTR